jgi:hypothetical protein
MKKFFLVEEVGKKKVGRVLKIVVPFGRITFQEMKKLMDENQIILIDNYKYKLISFDDDMLFHKPDDEFTFFGKSMFGLLVEDP